MRLRQPYYYAGGDWGEEKAKRFSPFIRHTHLHGQTHGDKVEVVYYPLGWRLHGGPVMAFKRYSGPMH